MPTYQQLNLDLDKLKDATLNQSPIYRRLCNIMSSDMTRSDLSFRKSLLKELYFLLQMAPVIKPEHLPHFLEEVEKWYNLNDHKKIDLASSRLNNLRNFMKNNHNDGVQETPQP